MRMKIFTKKKYLLGRKPVISTGFPFMPAGQPGD